MSESENNCSATKRALKNLCVTNGWSYGVFFGFDHRNPMLLTLQDSYYEERLGLSIDNLLHKFHMLGEGTIGQSALNGKHQWIFADGFGREWNAFRSNQVDSEVYSQFSSGIKTIVAIPVEPRGVVQFGSTEKISESLEFVDRTIRLFRDSNALHSPENHQPCEKLESYDISALFASLLPSQNSPMISDQPSTSTGFHIENNTHFETAFRQSNFSAKSDFVDRGINTWGFQVSPDVIHSKGNPFSTSHETENNFQAGSGNATDDQQSLTSVFEGFLEDFKPDDFSADLFSLCQADDLSQWLDSSQDHNINQMVNSLSGDLTQLVESDTAIEDPTNSVEEKSVIVQSSESGESREDIVIPLVNGNYPLKCLSGLNSSVAAGPRKGLFSELGLEELLAGTNSASCLTGSNLEDQSCMSAKRRRVESVSSSGNAGFSHYDTEYKEIPKSQVGLWIDDSYSITPASTIVSSKQQKSEECKKVARKRARPGESTRPRPKDRQLIQDRIKELRGIIPSSGKCSIDSLLERTIKYMVFLQGVTKHGDKLKQPTKPKLIGSENGAVLRDKNNMSGGGATWAYEVGGQSMACPIIVEDLSSPGQMLIEMLCEEQGFFLEIADIIRGFGLIILRGVMEAREDKIWAHFIVEAKSHTTRLEIFWSLVRLLQRTSTSTVNSDIMPSNSVLDGGIPLMESYHKPNLPPPICLTETLH